MKYALIQMPSSAILVVDNHDSIGKGHVEWACANGGKPVGTIESDLSANVLLQGIRMDMRTERDELEDRIRLAQKALLGEFTQSEMKEK